MKFKLLSFDNRTIRMLIDEQGRSWWSIADICHALNIEKAHRIIRTLDEGDIGLAPAYKNSTTKIIHVVNEAGLKVLLNASSKRGAYKLNEWVESEILPALKTRDLYDIKGNEGFNPPRIQRQSFSAWKQKAENRTQQDKETLCFPTSACNENDSSTSLKSHLIQGNGIRQFNVKVTFDGLDDIRYITLIAPYGVKQLTLLWDLEEKSMRLIKCAP